LADVDAAAMRQGIPDAEGRASASPPTPPLAAGCTAPLTLQTIIDTIGPDSEHYGKWLLVKGKDVPGLLELGIKHLGDAVGW
jgi:hypothetical protein